MNNQVEAWFFDIPPVTRCYVTGVVLLTAAVVSFTNFNLQHLQLLAPFHLFFSWSLIRKHGHYWRLLTSFFYFGSLSFDLLFHLYFLYALFGSASLMDRMRYSRMTEETSFRSRPWDYLWMLFLGCSSMIVSAAIFDRKKAIPFLSTSLNFMLVYVWSRRNPHVRMNFLGVMNFNAPYLPWVLMGFNVLLNNFWPWGDILGLVVGHIFYFLEDVYPRMPGSGGRRLLQAPTALKNLFAYWNRDRADAALPAEEARFDDVEPRDLNAAREPVPDGLRQRHVNQGQ